MVINVNKKIIKNHEFKAEKNIQKTFEFIKNRNVSTQSNVVYKIWMKSKI